MSTEKKIEEMRRWWGDEDVEVAEAKARALANDEFDALLSVMSAKSESPIERLLVAAMLYNGYRAMAGRDDCAMVRLCNEFACLPQKQFGVYRSDFLFHHVSMVNIASAKVWVELDGHDFHERTKEQVSRDKRRDRAFAAAGETVLRFTGSDVYQDPFAVLEEIQSTLRSLAAKKKSKAVGA